MCLMHQIHPEVQTLLAGTLRCRDCRTGEERPGGEKTKVLEQGAPRSGAIHDHTLESTSASQDFKPTE